MHNFACRPSQIYPSRWRTFLSLLATLLVTMAAMATSAQEPSKDAMQSLDEQVQEIKSDVLAIAAELNNLEERLLYPSNSQVAIFVIQRAAVRRQGRQPG